MLHIFTFHLRGYAGKNMVISFPRVLDEITQQLLLVNWENVAVDINIINVGLCTGDN